MGNSNSGRYGGKVKCENCLSLDVRHFVRKGWLKNGAQLNLTWSNGSSMAASIQEHSINLSYAIKGGDSFIYPIYLATTDCNYGGKRTWLICPRCHGRNAKLFLRNGRFACRTCQRLRYHSQALDPMGRNQWAYGRVQKKLIEGEGKPKGMHWRTFERLCDRLEVIDAKIDGAFIIRVAGFMRRVGTG
jgi:hypothetical protein